MSIPYPTIDKTSPLPVALQVVNHYRTMIDTNAVNTGTRIQGADAIARNTGIGKTTVADALDQLGSMGYLKRAKRRANRLRTPPPSRVISSDRYSDEITRQRTGTADTNPSTALTRELHVPWSDYHITPVSADIMEPTRRHRELLDTEQTVHRRQVVDYIKGEPIQIRTTVMPRSITKDTFIESPDYINLPGGTIAELYALDQTPSPGKVWHQVIARPIRSDEVDLLGMAKSLWVFEVTRVFYRGTKPDIPVEASELVIPCPGAVLEFTTQLD